MTNKEPKPLIKVAPSCPIKIYIAGDYDKAIKSTKEYCDETGYCVTVTPTVYVHTGGLPSGVIVGLINYPRFPQPADAILERAVVIAKKLRIDLDQESFSIETPNDTIWYSYRKDDVSED